MLATAESANLYLAIAMFRLCKLSGVDLGRLGGGGGGGGVALGSA